ncbi:acyltransferase-domain-containing protein [Auricularia subglabra TFB-10046 SS5]|nr:acyltransferase-domain-containing protein [Auricularia subglabra TFB-10046 SS5]
MQRLVCAAVGLASKAFLRLGCKSVKVAGLPILLKALEEQNRTHRGVLTVSNHVSVLDDPLMWGVLPAQSYFDSRRMRWTLGASDILFTRPILSAFFRSGQVVETFRGSGIRQAAIDNAVKQLDRGDWIHLFPEGKVNQILSAQAQLLRFKWGIGRMLMDTERTPVVIPMWLTGFDQVMPEKRSFPRFLPRIRKDITITFGEPTTLAKRLDDVLVPWRATHHGKVLPEDHAEEIRHRVQVTRIVQEEVEKLGYTVLSGAPFPSAK